MQGGGKVDVLEVFQRWRAEFESAAARDDYHWIVWELGPESDPSPARRRSAGRRLVERQVEAVAYVLSFRCMGGTIVPVEGERRWRDRFLALQAYGPKPADLGASYVVRLFSRAGDLRFVVDRMDDLDLEDLEHVYGFETVGVRSVTERMTATEAETIVSQMSEDLNYQEQWVTLDSTLLSDEVMVSLRDRRQATDDL